jgi:hypothetical protein
VIILIGNRGINGVRIALIFVWIFRESWKNAQNFLFFKRKSDFWVLFCDFYANAWNIFFNEKNFDFQTQISFLDLIL